MKTYCFTSIKGGVTKTTSTVDIAHGLAATGRRVLVIDADHQCNATLALLDSIREETTGTFYEVMMKRRPVQEVIVPTAFPNISVVQGSMELSNANTTLASQYGRETILQHAIEGVKGFHYVLIDTAPNTELITVNAWVASDALVVPLTPARFAMIGIRILERQRASIKRETKREYPILGVIIALDDHTVKSRTRAVQIREYFGDTVFRTVIPKNVTVENATDAVASIFEFAPGSTGAKAYANLVEEFIQRAES